VLLLLLLLLVVVVVVVLLLLAPMVVRRRGGPAAAWRRRCVCGCLASDTSARRTRASHALAACGAAELRGTAPSRCQLHGGCCCGLITSELPLPEVMLSTPNLSQLSGGHSRRGRSSTDQELGARQ
jgi:hypothetical protein